MQNPQKALEAVAEIKASIETVISAEVAARALGCDPASIRLQAEKDPALLGFPVCRMGRTTMIPRRPFLQWLTGE